MAAVSILVVDDNAQNLYLARYLLEQKGYTVSEARNGEDAVAVNQAEKESPPNSVLHQPLASQRRGGY